MSGVPALANLSSFSRNPKSGKLFTSVTIDVQVVGSAPGRKQLGVYVDTDDLRSLDSKSLATFSASPIHNS